MSEETKVWTNPNCSHGGDPQPITNFHIRTKDGKKRDSHCKDCKKMKDIVIIWENKKEKLNTSLVVRSIIKNMLEHTTKNGVNHLPCLTVMVKN